MPAQTSTEALIHALLSQAEDLVYLPNDEDAEEWKAASLRALSAITARGLLEHLDSEGRSIGSILHRLVTRDLCPLLEISPGRAVLVGELVRNLSEPGRINQGFKGTCAACSVESFLAEEHSAEYVRLVAGLMSAGGVVGLLNGHMLARDEDTLIWHQQEARRSPVSRLFQVAVMEFAYPKLDYHNSVDCYVLDDVEDAEEDLDTGTGLDLDSFDRLLEGVTGQRWDTLSEKQAHLKALLQKFGLDTSKVPDLKRDGMVIIRQAVAAGDVAFVTLESKTQVMFSEGALRHVASLVSDGPSWVLDPTVFSLPHKVRVLDIDEQRERIVYDDPLDPTEPWMAGVETCVEDTLGRCSMPLADFESMMVELSYRPVHWAGGRATSDTVPRS